MCFWLSHSASVARNIRSIFSTLLLSWASRNSQCAKIFKSNKDPWQGSRGGIRRDKNKSYRYFVSYMTDLSHMYLLDASTFHSEAWAKEFRYTAFGSWETACSSVTVSLYALLSRYTHHLEIGVSARQVASVGAVCSVNIVTHFWKRKCSHTEVDDNAEGPDDFFEFVKSGYGLPKQLRSDELCHIENFLDMNIGCYILLFLQFLNL